MALLKIIKLSTKTWKHNSNIDGDFILSKFYAKQENTDFLLVESYGAKRRKYKINEIEVYNIGGSAETFTNFEDLFLRLEELNYPAFYVDGEFIFNPSNYDLEDFTNESLNPFVREDELNFLSNNLSTYPTATTPISDTDQLFVIQGGVVKKVDKSEIGGGGTSSTRFYNVTNSSPVTGTTSLVLVQTPMLIPAGTFKTGDCATFRARIRRTVPTNANTTLYLYLSTLPSSATPDGVQMNYVIANLTYTIAQGKSEWVIKNQNNLTEIVNYTNINDDIMGNDYRNRVIDWDVDQYIYIWIGNTNTSTSSYFSFWELLKH